MTQTVEKTIKQILYKDMRVLITRVQRLPGGFNCSVYKVFDNDNRTYIAKKYILREEDKRNRLLVEFKSLSYLWKHDIRVVPQPIALSVPNNIGVYEFISGARFVKGKYTTNDIRAVTHFWQRIHELTKIPGSQSLPLAKESCFRLSGYISGVEKRLRMLQKLPTVGIYESLHEFLNSEFIPFYRQARQFIKVECARRRMGLDDVLKKEYRTLSPSDLGFHNAIKKSDGTIIFHDFEYFGWDDPAKMIADFYLHPRMALPYKFREFFYKNIYNELQNDVTLPQRLPFIYMLLALKWCLIMLNVFRRPETVAGKNEETCQEQLDKAKRHLNETISEFEMRSFPLSLLA